MNINIMHIPVLSTGNDIFISDVNLKDKMIIYRRGFNSKQKIEEDYIVVDNILCTALINFPVEWLDKWSICNNME